MTLPTPKGGGSGPLDPPEWNIEQMMIARDALNTLTRMGMDNVGALGTKEEIDPITHLIFAVVGWGGIRNKNTIGVHGMVENNDGSPHVLNVP